VQFANNKFIATLVISNIAAFTVIFILIWMLWNDSNTTNIQSTPTVQNLSAEENKPAAPPRSVRQKTVTIVDSIVQEMKSANLTPDDAENPDSSNTGKLSDKEYIDAFKKFEKDKKSVIKYTKKEVTSIEASDKKISSAEKNKNKVNIVDVSQLKQNSTDKKTLAQRVSSLVAENKNNGTPGPSNKNPGWQDYLKKLDVEGEVRKNEMRTIKVRKGETLWRISLRAYGTGFKYKKIFKANPHLTSPHAITTGEILKVPL